MTTINVCLTIGLIATVGLLAVLLYDNARMKKGKKSIIFEDIDDGKDSDD